MDDIAAALGVGRRTLFRYFPSKNDIVWGDFDQVLLRLRRDLAAQPPGTPVLGAIAAAVCSSNAYDAGQLPELRIRMGLITEVPALQAHSMLRYAAWRQVIAGFVAEREGVDADGVRAQSLAHAALGISTAAFRCWVTGHGELEANLQDGFSLLVPDRAHNF